MNGNHRYLISCTMVLSMMILSCPLLNYSQGRDQEIITSIVLNITTPKGHWAKAPVAEGKMITIVDAATGSGYGFVPVVRSIKNRSVELKMFQVIERELEVKVLKEVESTEIKLGAQGQMGSTPFEVKILAITQDFKDRDVSSKSANSLLCCVLCDDQRMCTGCGVLTDCGCCCVGRCCSICQP